MRHRIAVVLLPALLAGCASMTTPYSEITGERFNLAVADRRAVIIISVGKQSGWISNAPVLVDPGTYPVEISTPRARRLPAAQRDDHGRRRALQALLHQRPVPGSGQPELRPGHRPRRDDRPAASARADRMPMPAAGPLLAVSRLRVEFPTRRGLLVAVHDVSFEIARGRGAGRGRRVRRRQVDHRGGDHRPDRPAGPHRRRRGPPRRAAHRRPAAGRRCGWCAGARSARSSRIR